MLRRCDEYDGYYNFTSAAKIRRDGYERSRATNPMLLYDAPRYMTSGGEAVFPIGMWQDGRALAAGEPLTCRSMLPFYNHSRFPDDFWRRDGQFGFAQLFPGVMKLKMVNTENGVHMLEAGHNEGLGNFVKVPADLQTMLDTNPVRPTAQSLIVYLLLTMVSLALRTLPLGLPPPYRGSLPGCNRPTPGGDQGQLCQHVPSSDVPWCAARVPAAVPLRAALPEVGQLFLKM